MKVGLTRLLLSLPAARHAPVRCDLDDAARLAVLSLPTEPDVALEPADVMYAVCRGLQCNDVPEPDAGLARLFNFATYECRAALTARQGKETVERFKKYADSPVMDAILRCSTFEPRTEPTVIAGTPTRGALATQVVTVVEERGFRTSAGLERKPEDQGTFSEDYLFTLQQERRPPLAGCWMVKEMIMMKHHMIFAGDSGAVNS